MESNQAVFPNRLRPEQRFSYAVGGLLCLSGCLHVLVWLFDGGSLAGPISWRKPILFGLSAGVTVISVAWVAGKSQRRCWDWPLLVLFSTAMLVEVGLITLQQWRGVASHFNRETPFDANILAGIEWLILFATLVIAEMTRRSLGKLSTTAEMTLAIRCGMGLLLLSCALGFVMAAYGNHRVARGLAPDVYPPAGVMKFPHGVPMHAIQYLPILAWLLRKLDVTEAARYRAVACAFASAVAFTVFSLLQTFTGRARFEFWWLSWGALLIAVVLVLVPFYTAFVRAERNSPGRETRIVE